MMISYDDDDEAAAAVEEEDDGDGKWWQMMAMTSFERIHECSLRLKYVIIRLSKVE